MAVDRGTRVDGGLTLGGILAAIGFVPAFFLAEWNVHGALVVSTTVATVVLLGALVGSMLPVIFKRMGMDPALMSNPLIAALCDVSGVVIFYTLVTLVLT